MQPVWVRLRGFLRVHPVAPHLLQTADVSGADLLPGVECGGFFLAGNDAGHVVQGVLPHGLLHGHGLRHGARGGVRGGESQAGADLIGRLALTGTADAPEDRGIPVPAQRTADHLPLAFMPQHGGPYTDGTHTENIGSGVADFLLQTFRILLGLSLFLEEPGPDLRPGSELVHIKVHPHAFAGMLVEQAQGVDAEIADTQPAVARGAGGQKLHRVRQALHRFADGVVEDAFGQCAAGRFHHISADDHPRCGVAVELTDFFHKLVVSPGADGHTNLLASGVRLRCGRPGDPRRMIADDAASVRRRSAAGRAALGVFR